MLPLKLILLEELKSPFLSAASGMVWVNDEMFIIADDELSLFSYPLDFEGPGTSYRLFPGELPVGHRERKAAKPDLESLFLFENFLYCMPSGSTPQRMRAAKFNLDTGIATQFDCSPLYQKLLTTFSELNIEGSILKGEELYLFQRGNGSKNENAVIKIDFVTFGLLSIHPVKLEPGYSFTDAAIMGDQIYFTAVAENSVSTYEDGEVTGSMLGMLDEDLKVSKQYPLNFKHKPEGLWVSGNYFYVVTDDDDNKKAARLFKGELPR